MLLEKEQSLRKKVLIKIGKKKNDLNSWKVFLLEEMNSHY